MSANAGKTAEPENPQIILNLLESVARDGAQSQRGLAAELNIALGLVNSYLRRCVKKGLLKVSDVPARRYAYYLTPNGFAEKSRLTVEYLSSSFGFFRQAKMDCSQIFETAKARGFSRLALAGRSELAEVAAICALESAVSIAALVDPETCDDRFLHVPVVRSFADIGTDCDAVVITDLVATQKQYNAAAAWIGKDRVFVPKLLRRHIDTGIRAAS